MTRTASPSRTASRFSRTGAPATSRSRLGRQRSTTASPRYGIAGGWMQRRQPQKSGPKRVLENMTSLVPGIAKNMSGGSSRGNRRRRGGKAGGVALVSAAAGMAYKNREKLMSIFKREGSDAKADTTTSPVEAGTRPTTGAGDPIRSGNIAPTDPGNRPDIAPPAS